MKYLLLTTLCLAILLPLVQSCSRPPRETAEQAGPAPEDAEDEVSRPVESAPERTITLGPSEPSASRTADRRNNSDRQTASRAARSRDLLVAARPGDGYLPEEFQIGPLADRFSEDPDRRAIYKAVWEFFQELAAAELPAQSILPDSRAAIRRTLDLALTESYLPDQAAIGQIIITEKTGRLNVALSGDPGRTEGEVSVAKLDDRWYVSDIQIDFSKLSVEPDEEERFEPVSYDWQVHSR